MRNFRPKIFIPENGIAEKSLISMFKLFHELGHWGNTDYKVKTILGVSVTPVCFMFTFAILSNIDIYMLAGLWIMIFFLVFSDIYLSFIL